MSCGGPVLRTVVQFERNTPTVKLTGGQQESWAAVSGAPTRAHVKASSGRHGYREGRTEHETRYRVTTRYFEGIQEGDRVLIQGRYHRINFINNVDFANRWLEIDVSGGVAIRRGD